ncbi:MAG: hypothetical protein ACT4O9_15000 [Blastocatellia bacterium]
MSKKNLTGLTATLLFATVAFYCGYLALQGYYSDPDSLVWEFRGAFASREFKPLYQNSSDFMKANVSETEFVRRMTAVAEVLAEYDSEPNLRRNLELEDRIREIRSASGDPDPPEYSFVILEIGHPEKAAQVHISWVRDGIKPKLFDLSIGDSGVSLTNRINTLAGKPFRSGE